MDSLSCVYSDYAMPSLAQTMSSVARLSIMDGGVRSSSTTDLLAILPLNDMIQR